MDFGGVALLSLLGVLACPLLMAVGLLRRWLPWRTIVAKARGIARSPVRRMLAIAVFASASLSVPTVAAGTQDTAAACAGQVWLDVTSATSETDSTAQASSAMPSWMTADLTDACTGEAFTLADFAGKTVYVESMATWCGECYEQLTRVTEAFARIPEAERDNIVLVALSSEIDLPREDLANYAEKTGFPLLFAVMRDDLLKAMVDDLGREWAIPPAMPHLIVSPDGTVGDLHTGGSSVDELLAMFAEARQQTAP